MFASSTQLKYWTFSGETELKQLRQEANQNYVEAHCQNMNEEERMKFFLSPAEERLLIRQFEYVLKEFYNKFQPPLPKCVLGTALAFFKRFWVNNSPMDFHPKDIMLTCVYLACKVEEVYVPISTFVGNLKGNREKFADTILSFELKVLCKLHYQLTVHNPFRAMEGLLIDIKTRFKQHIGDAEKLRPRAEEFIERALMTDVVLIFSPSQISLAALIHSASMEGLSLDRYVADELMAGSSMDDIKKLIYQLKRVRHMLKSDAPLVREQLGPIQKKLEKCRNPENNPECDIYRAKVAEESREDDDETDGS